MFSGCIRNGDLTRGAAEVTRSPWLATEAIFIKEEFMDWSFAIIFSFYNNV